MNSDGRVVQFAPRATAASGEAIHRGIGGAVGLCIDQIEDGLSLVTVDAAVQEGALRELPPAGEPRTCGHASLKDAARRDRASVALELNDVLAGVAPRGSEHQHDSLVDCGTARRIAQTAEGETSGFGYGSADAQGEA